ncbi:hypothetical protein [Parasutterella sp.]|uniref:AbrB/MazE/SpoVT family DNA-binding domain-containing protein n=1 Tax=Parasutterella sp. TaxID=2049037 RepID=UPI003AB2C686
MSTLELRQIGDAVVLILPQALLEQLNAKPGDSLNYNFGDRKLVINQKRKLRKLPKYDLNMLLTEHKQILPFLESEYEAWGIQKPEGTEML